MRGEDGVPSHGLAPEPTRFDLGDSRDLAAAVKAAWGDNASGPTAAPAAVPRPPLTRGGTEGPTSGRPDPLAHLRGETVRTRRVPRVGVPLRLQTMRRSTLVASAAAGVAVVLAAAVPVFGGREPARLTRVADERPTPTTAAVRAVPTTAFTYPPETLVPVESTAPPATAAPANPAGTPVASARPTATTAARPKSTPTTRRPSPTTTRPAPATTTTQPAPPPSSPPDDDGGSSEPPPYP